MLFAREIELRLRKHDADRGESWKEMGVFECIGYIARWVVKLKWGLFDLGSHEEIRQQAASVAAAAMFAADNFGDLRNELE